MDPSKVIVVENENKKKRGSSDVAQEVVQDDSKRSCRLLPTDSDYVSAEICEELQTQFLQQVCKELERMILFIFHSYSPSSPSSGCVTAEVTHLIREVVNRFAAEIWPIFEHEFRQRASKEIKKRMLLTINSLSQPLSKQLESGSGSVTSNLRLSFHDSTIFYPMYPGDSIKSMNGELLKFELRDANSNTIISTGRFSFARVEFFLLEQDLDSSKPRTLCTRDKTMELISGNDLKLYLQNGIGYVKDIIVTRNSYWISKYFYLGIKVIDNENCIIEEAISNRFRVMTQRMKEFEKHHPPSKDSEVWRLVGIGKNGTFHKILSSQLFVNTVGDFLEAHQRMGSIALKEILGEKMSMKKLGKIVEHAKHCVDFHVPTDYDQTFDQIIDLEENDKGEASCKENKKYGENDELLRTHSLEEGSAFQEWLSKNIDLDYMALSPLP